MNILGAAGSRPGARRVAGERPRRVAGRRGDSQRGGRRGGQGVPGATTRQLQDNLQDNYKTTYIKRGDS